MVRYAFITIGLLFLFCCSQLKAASLSVFAKKGVVDISGLSLQNDERYLLKGEWIIFDDTLINPEHIDEALKNLPFRYLSVPSKASDLKGHKFGTYYLKFTTDSIPFKISINSLTVYSAAELFVDGERIAHIGKPASIEANAVGGLVLSDHGVFLNQGEHELLVQFANYYREKSGLANNVSFESYRSKTKRSVIQLIKYAIILGTILFIIFNQITYYLTRKDNLSSLYFGIASIFIFCYIIFMSTYYFVDISSEFNPNIRPTLIFWRISYYLSVCFFTLYIRSLFQVVFHDLIRNITVGYCSFSVLVTIFLPLSYSSVNFKYFMYFTLFIALYLVVIGVIGIIRRIPFSTLFIFGFAFFAGTVINDVLHNLLIINSVNLLDVGIFGMMLTQAQIINLKLHRSLNHSEDLSNHLQYVNQNLETIVSHRTEEIEMQKAEIEAQRDEILEQRDYAMNQHQIISSQKKTITDSINYAKEIQYAVLPDEQFLTHYFKDSFILFLPKDFVSGDFYWMREFNVDGKKYFSFCIADCTGHGVPGALLSMLGMSILNEIVLHQTITKASQLLEELRDRFKYTLEDHLKKQASSDGMHITACVLSEDGMLDCAGAFQSFYHIRGEKVMRIKGTRSIIGVFMNEVPFVSTQIQLEKGDRLYFFTDGYADQMSGKGYGRFMQKNMLAMFKSMGDVPMDKQRGIIQDRLEQWRGSFEQIDDVLIIGVEY